MVDRTYVVDFRGAKGGGKGGGGTSRAAKEQPNTLQSNTIARVIDVVSEGEIGGLVDGLKSVYFDDTAVMNSDGSYNFSGVKITERTGTPDQTYVSGFPSVESEVVVGLEVLKTTPITRTITDADATAVRVKVQIPALTRQDTSTGDLGGYSVTFRIDIKPNGGTWGTAPLDIATNPVTISGKTTSPYEASYRIALPEGGAPWDIRVVRITDDQTTLGANIQARTYWSTYTIVVDNKLQYPDTALFGVEVDAQQFSQEVPSRAYEVYGLKILVPQNYDPATRSYTGLWNGTFKRAWSDNPAWVLYDILTNKRYGLGTSISSINLDKFSLYEIAQYCDELVDDGFGGLEPRYTFNGVLNTREEAYRVIAAISSCFRGMVYWSSGMVTATTDKPADPVKLVTPANVIDGAFNYQGSSLKSRHSVAVVRYNDPDNGYDSGVVVVEDPEMVQQMGWVPTPDISAYGCTSKGQAYRLGKWTLDAERYSTEVVSYKAALDHADIKPGDIVSIADPHYAGARYGGRLVSASGSTLVLDDYISLSGGESYTISVVMPDGTIEERPITSASGAIYNTISIGGADLPYTPDAGAMWVVTGTNVAPRQFRIVSIVESEKNIFEVSGLFHDPNKYARVEQGVYLEDVPYSLLPSGPIKPPMNITHTEYLYKVNSVLRSAVTLSWSASPDPRVGFYEVTMRRPGNDYFESVKVTATTSIDIEDTPDGVYVFRVRAIDGLGNKSQFLEETRTVLGLLYPPADVTGLKISNIGAQATLSWNKSNDLDLAYYTIKFTPALSNPQWGAGVVLVERVPKEASTAQVPTLVGSYMIKAVDSSGKESDGIAFVSTNVRNINQYNVVSTVDEHLLWGGSHSNTHIDAGNLKLVDFSTIGTYTFSGYQDFGGVFTVRIVAGVTASGEIPSDSIDEWITLSSVQRMTNADPSNWGVEIQVSTTDDDPSGSPTWSDWSTFQIGYYTTRAMKFRAVLRSNDGLTGPNIAGLSVIIDLEDRTESGDDVLTNTSGESVVLFARAFKAIPAIGVAAQDMGGGDYYTISSKSRSGFTVNFYNASDVGVQRTFDWIAKGYGAEE